MPADQPMRRPWLRAALWGLGLGILFFTSYGAANHFTATRHDVGIYAFAWERHIPFLAWTIIPYWSIDFLYGIALFLSRSREELGVLARRLLCAQIVCISGFLLWPLHFSFARPATSGLSGMLFDMLTGFDLPYNQAPSLHICLLVVLWQFYAGLVRRPLLRVCLHAWFALIGISVLTTYQHHFIDLLTGAWAGMLCLFLVPANDARWQWRANREPKRWRLAGCYATGAALAGVLGWLCFPLAWAWPLYWVALALACVALIYTAGDGAHFGKRNGRLPWHVMVLLGPYLLAARVNAWLWTRHLPMGAEVVPGVFLGRQPDAASLARLGISHVVDLCAELPGVTTGSVRSEHATLDLLPPEPQTLRAAALAIEAAHQAGPVWVCCALGFSRSALAVLAWLVRFRGLSVEAALGTLHAARPQIVLPADTPDMLQTLWEQTGDS